MKLQHLAIIFVIIILPISMVISEYIEAQIDTISLQTQYSSKLHTATHDAIKAFQLNTLNNKYSTVSDSKIRDLEASINTFYNSLGTELGASGYDTESLQQFIPAIVYTMYDGYYIYGKYYNYNENKYQYGLRPYIYYSCRYIKGTNDFVVNYTLDNTITIYGKVYNTEKGITEYITKSGALINPDLIDKNSIQTVKYTYVNNVGNTIFHEYVTSIKYDNVVIEKEILEEQLITISDDGKVFRNTYQYVNYSNRKVYKEINVNEDNNNNGIIDDDDYFWYSSNKKQYITDEETLQFVKHMTDSSGNLCSNSAAQYYADAYEFSKWVRDELGDIKQSNAVDSDGKAITDFAINTGDEEIFDLTEDNNPLIDSSAFNQNRISVIRRTIQTTLNTAIANYSSSANYEFAMPIFTEQDWDILVNNISVASFMQGMPIGSKYFNNYCIIANNKNKEIVTKDSIYIITDGNNEAHKVASKDVIDNKKKVIGAYKNTDFEIQTVVISGMPDYHYYPHANNKCYECMVNVSPTYSIDDIIEGNITYYDKNTDEYKLDNTKDIKDLRKIYLTALARERYDLYKTNAYFGVK